MGRARARADRAFIANLTFIRFADPTSDRERDKIYARIRNRPTVVVIDL